MPRNIFGEKKVAKQHFGGCIRSKRRFPDGVLRQVQEGEASQCPDGVRHLLELATLQVQVLEAGVEAAHRVVRQGEVVVGQLQGLEPQSDESVVGDELDPVATEVQQTDEPELPECLDRDIPD